MANELKPCPFCQCEPKLVRPMGDRLHNDKPPYYGPEKYRYSCSSNTCCVMTNCHDTEEEARTQWNTRPAAPVEGLETELICNRSADRANVEDEWRPWSEWRIGQPHFSEEWLSSGLFKNEHVEFVTRSQAEAIIAAKDERISELEELLRISESCNHFADNLSKEMKTLETDNAALTARVKELAAERTMIVSHATMGGTDGVGLSVNDISVRVTALRNELYNEGKKRAEALETQLAAAKDIVSRAQEIIPDSYINWHDFARAALEAKP